MNDRKPNETFSKSLAIAKTAESGTYTFIGSYETVDRDGDIVYVDGIDTKNFDTNPIVLFNHDTNQPIGKALGHRIEMIDGHKALVFDVEFSSIPEAQKVKTLVDEGILNTTSIRFIGTKYSIIESNERFGYDITESELLELSIAPVPANAGALIQKTLELIKLDEPTESENTDEGISPEEPVDDKSEPVDTETGVLSDDVIAKTLAKSLGFVDDEEIYSALNVALTNKEN